MNYEDTSGSGGLGGDGGAFCACLFSKFYIFIYLFQESTQLGKAYGHEFRLSMSAITLPSI